jgi:hypothetical protein
VRTLSKIVVDIILQTSIHSSPNRRNMKIMPQAESILVYAKADRSISLVPAAVVTSKLHKSIRIDLR